MTAPETTTDRERWTQLHRDLLHEEKASTRERDRLARRRRELPLLTVRTDYSFTGPDGPVTLGELFAGHDQLVVYHFMFGADWDEGCPICSFWADSFDGASIHLPNRNTAFACISNAPIDKLVEYRDRMGWSFTWVSAAGTSFNADMGVSHDLDELDDDATPYNYGTAPAMGPESAGLSTFLRDERGIHLAYQTFGRGLEVFNATYNLLDLTARGRDEGELAFPMAWVRRHDQF